MEWEIDFSTGACWTIGYLPGIARLAVLTAPEVSVVYCRQGNGRLPSVHRAPAA